MKDFREWSKEAHEKNLLEYSYSGCYYEQDLKVLWDIFVPDYYILLDFARKVKAAYMSEEYHDVGCKISDIYGTSLGRDVERIVEEEGL